MNSLIRAFAFVVALVPNVLVGELSPLLRNYQLESHFSETELDREQVGITIVFKPGIPIPSDEILKAFLPLEGRRGPFGRRFVASARQIRDALRLDGFQHIVSEDGTHYRTPVGKVTLPIDWAHHVRVVLGLDSRPVALPRYVRAFEQSKPKGLTSLPLLPTGWPPFGYFPTQLAELYSFPHGGLGEGQTIGIVALTSVTEPSGFYPDDVEAYFTLIGVTPPVIDVVSVDGAVNSPTNPSSGGDVEVCLDIETAGAIAPSATIEVFFAPNTSDGFYDCFATMLSPPYSVSVASCSYGSPEVINLFYSADFSTDYMLSFEELFASVWAQSTVCVAAGDFGSDDADQFLGFINTPGTGQVGFPESCPHALAVGGTSVNPKYNHLERIKEVVWNLGNGGRATGGGVSAVFDLPDYQKEHNIHIGSINNHRLGRVVPDVALMADPFQGYNIRVDYYNTNGVGGTSAAAPMWAGLIARLNYINGGTPLGFINPLLYKHHYLLKKITKGSNGQYFAQHNYDACTGLGVPSKDIYKIIDTPRSPEAELKTHPSGGVPKLTSLAKKKKIEKLTLFGDKYRSPAGATLHTAYTAEELRDEAVEVLFIFKEKVNKGIEASLRMWAESKKLSFVEQHGPFAYRLKGSLKRLARAFRLKGFDRWQCGDTQFRHPAGDVKLPKDELWATRLRFVAGLDTLPIACRTFPVRKYTEDEGIVVKGGHSSSDSSQFPYPYPGVSFGDWNAGYFPFELAKLYGYPTKGFGKGQTVSVIELAGGYSDDDLAVYWAYMGIANPPDVSWVGVDGATNNYTGNLLSDDWIPTSDIEIIGTIAPDSSIQVVFAPNTMQGLYDALVAAIYTYPSTVVSTVWGMPESQWPPSMMYAIDDLIGEANRDGITVLASSGSHGSSDGVADGEAHVDFPASSPNTLAVGTTTLLADGYHRERLNETAWNEGYGINASGGGVSDFFGVPHYQKKHGIKPKSANHDRRKGRGVPDVSSVGDPLGFYTIPIFVDDQNWYTTPYPPGPYQSLFYLDLPCGTVATPTWAGLVARLKSISKKPIGLLQNKLYKHRRKCFTDIKKGSNGAYKAKHGYDLVTGLGVPNEKISELVE